MTTDTASADELIPPEVTPSVDVRPRLDSVWLDPFVALGDWAAFASRVVTGLFSRSLKRSEFLRACVEIGVGSFSVVAITGLFIGMVLAVQAYNQFRMIGMETSLGAVIHMSIVRELGPVLAAVMLAGRIGTAMAAQLGTMRVTEQIDALACLGVDPVKYLVTPRLLACLVMIPLLTLIADALGIVGSSLIALRFFNIDGFHYWRHTSEYVTLWDVSVGMVKSIFFGGAMCLVCCHRGFRSRAGAEGVGRAATEGFVLSFVLILALDFLMAIFTNTLTQLLWPHGGGGRMA
ncbi:MAG: MlaE family ABC transporter permease [Fimbriiglobus sp.]